MEDTELKATQIKETQTKEFLTPLPFAYKRTNDPEKASYREWRVSPVSIKGRENKPRTDEEILEFVRKQHEGKRWYTLEYWREKGLPTEQLELIINDRQITVCNYNREKPFTDRHINRAKEVFGQLAARFPQILNEVRWLLIDNVQPPSLLGDDELYPTNGVATREHQVFRLMPRGMELFPHRIEATSNFEGTLVHESAHLIWDEFEDEWREKFRWEYCFDHKDDWEFGLTKAGERKWLNKQTGEMSPQGEFPLQPDKCVNFYARQNAKEDICESLVAYVYDPELLKRVSPEKFGILQRHDAKQETPDISVRRVPEAEIKLPEIKPETVFYFVQEPE